MDTNFNQDPEPGDGIRRYYRLESRKLSYREYWNILHSWQVIIPWTAKLFNRPMKFTSGMPYYESVRELKVAEGDFPAEALEGLQSRLDQSLALGFHSPQFHTYRAALGEVITSFIALLHPSGATLRLMYSAAKQVHPPKVSYLAVCVSELSDGTYFYSSDQTQKFQSAPEMRGQHLPGASLERLVQAHLRQIEALQNTNPARPVESMEALDQLWDRYETVAREFGMKRGIYVWMTPEEVAAEQKQLVEVKLAAGPAEEHLEVQVEINKLQNKKAGWGGVILLLIVSLALFVGTGSRLWSWDYVLIIVGVLFIHELGHYAAMRAFHYRNLRMFFIPFFGAAVSGQHYNVPGWKKVIVSLMGPVPGIILGVIIGSAGLFLNHALLTKVAVLMLILNGFNLIPVLPFDGGWVFHTLLFSRHYLLDTAFRLLAAFALLAGGMFGGLKILTYVSIPMFISIPAAYRMARIAAMLRQRGVPPVSADDQTIPPDTAQIIIGELKQNSSGPQPAKVLAQQTLQIFETLNARPPGWPTTIGFLLAHFVSLGVAVAGAAIFWLGPGVGFPMGGDSSVMHEPQRTAECEEGQFWNGEQATNASSEAQTTLVATFASGRAAKRMFASMTNQLPPVARLTIFGESLIMVLPAKEEAIRKDWFSRLQRKTKEVFVDSTNFPTAMSMTFEAPNQERAKEIVEKFEGYLETLPDRDLVPPWFPHDDRSQEELELHQLARKTYRWAKESELSGVDDEEMRLIQDEMNAARRRGARAEVAVLGEQTRQLTRKLQLQSLEGLRHGIKGPIDTNLLEIFIVATAAEAGTNTTHDRLLEEMAKRMGQLPVRTIDDRFSAMTGMVLRENTRIQLYLMAFKQIGVGPQSMMAWLCDQGCSDFKYEFVPGAGYFDAK